MTKLSDEEVERAMHGVRAAAEVRLASAMEEKSHLENLIAALDQVLAERRERKRDVGGNAPAQA